MRRWRTELTEKMFTMLSIANWSEIKMTRTCWYNQFHHLHDDIVNHIILFAYGYEIRKHDLKNNEISMENIQLF